MAESIISRAVGVSKTYVDRRDDLKVDKEPGKGLSSNDYTNEDKNKVGNSLQGIRLNGSTITPDSNKTVNIPLASRSAPGFMSAGDKSKLDNVSGGTTIMSGTGNPSGGSLGDVYFKYN